MVKCIRFCIALLVVFIENVQVQIPFLHLRCVYKNRYIELEDIEELDLLSTLTAL